MRSFATARCRNDMSGVTAVAAAAAVAVAVVHVAVRMESISRPVLGYIITVPLGAEVAITRLDESLNCR